MSKLREAARAVIEQDDRGSMTYRTAHAYDAIDALRAALAATEPTQKPVVWANMKNIQSDHFLGIVGVHEVRTQKVDGYYDAPLYAHPAPPQTPMTDDQILEACGVSENSAYVIMCIDFARAVERHHGIGPARGE